MIDKLLFELPEFRRALAVMACASVLTGLCVIGQGWTLATALANLWHGAPPAAQMPWLAAFACCFVARQGIANVQSRWLDGYAAARADELRESVLRRLFAEGRRMVQETGSGNLTTLVLEGADQVETYLRLILPKMASIVIIPLMLLVVVFPLDWVSGLIALIVFPAIILQMVLIGSTAQQVAGARHEEFQSLSNHFSDSLRGIDTLKLFGRSKAHGRSVYESSERFREATMKTLRVATLSSAVLDIFSTLSLAAVAVMLGFRLVDGSVVLFPALVVLVVLPEYFRPIREFASDYHASLDGKNSLVSLMRLAKAKTAPKSEVDAPILPWTAQAEVTFSQVDFAYEERQANGSAQAHEALRDVSFSVRGFKKVGIVGPSGGGKTTLVNLLAGFAAPTKGVVSVNGQAVSTLERADWHRQVAYIPQDPYLFHATLRENVAFYRPDATEREVEDAVRAVGLDTLAAELPDGLDTLLGEGARTLSGGQAQRIALARALLDPERRIWLFDEPTAHLDIETEMELKERMLPLMEGRLVFFATHRLHWLQEMDVVLRLENGTVRCCAAGQDAACGSGAPRTTLQAMREGCQKREGGRERQKREQSAEASHAACGQSRQMPRDACEAGLPSGAASSAAERADRFADLARLKAVWKEDRWVRPFFRRYRKTLAFALALGVAAAFFAAALMFTSGYLIGGAALLPASILLLNLPLMFVRLFGVGKPVLQYFERLVSHDWVLRMTSALRLKLWGALERDAVFFRGRHRLGDVLGLLSEDIGHVQNLYLRTVFPTVIAWVLAALVVVGMGVLTLWAGALLCAVFGAAVIAVPLASLMANGPRAARRKELRSRMYADLADNVLGVADWVFSGRAQDYLARHEGAQRELRTLEAAAHRFDRARDLAVQMLYAAGALVVVMWAAGAFGANGAGVLDGSPNWILAFALGYFPLLDSFAPLPLAAVETRAHEDSIARMNRLSAEDGDAALTAVEAQLAAEEADSAQPTASAFREDASAPVATDGGEENRPHAPLCLSIEDVAFAYPGTPHTVLDGLALRIAPGEHVAVLGRSGSGKSTLASLVRGDLSPTAGRVTLGGVATASLGDAASSYFGVIQQNTYLFNTTLRENLRVGNSRATDAELEDVLARVGLSELLARLPEGLDTLVDEAGLRFSGGERHRVALARVLLQDSPVVILDEPTVGLDPETERAVLDTLLDALAEKTVLMITHHLPGVSRTDRVVFLDEGRVKQDGSVAMDAPPAELAERSPHYRRLLAFDGVMR